jgi:hypothetical protein
MSVKNLAQLPQARAKQRRNGLWMSDTLACCRRCGRAGLFAAWQRLTAPNHPRAFQTLEGNKDWSTVMTDVRADGCNMSMQDHVKVALEWQRVETEVGPRPPRHPTPTHPFGVTF